MKFAFEGDVLWLSFCHIYTLKLWTFTLSVVKVSENEASVSASNPSEPFFFFFSIVGSEKEGISLTWSSQIQGIGCKKQKPNPPAV